MSPNRIVATLTPLAALLAGIAADWLARNAPGVDLPASALEEVFVAGIAAVVAPAVVWLLGWQKHELRQAEAAQLAGGAASPELELSTDDGGDAFDPLLEGLDESPTFGDPEDPGLDELSGFEDMDELTGLGDDDETIGLEDVDELDKQGDDELIDSPVTERVG